MGKTWRDINESMMLKMIRWKAEYIEKLPSVLIEIDFFALLLLHNTYLKKSPLSNWFSVTFNCQDVQFCYPRTATEAS